MEDIIFLHSNISLTNIFPFTVVVSSALPILTFVEFIVPILIVVDSKFILSTDSKFISPVVLVEIFKSPLFIFHVLVPPPIIFTGPEPATFSDSLVESNIIPPLPEYKFILPSLVPACIVILFVEFF